MKISTLSAAVWLLLAVLFAISTQAQEPNSAPGGNPTESALRFESVPPDSNKREKSHAMTYRGKTLIQERISYLDETTKLREFRPEDGTLYGEVEVLKKGVLRITRYLADGIGKKEMIVGGPKAKIQATSYRPDGKTPWKVATSDVKGSQRISATDYLDTAGKVRLKHFQEGLSNVYMVYDDKGEEVYRQGWVSGEAGNVLISVTETTDRGVKRRVNLLNKTVEYLKDDGSVDKTSPYDPASEAVKPERLKTPEIPEAPE